MLIERLAHARSREHKQTTDQKSWAHRLYHHTTQSQGTAEGARGQQCRRALQVGRGDPEQVVKDREKPAEGGLQKLYPH